MAEVLNKIHELHRLVKQAGRALKHLDATYHDPNQLKTGLYMLKYLYGEVKQFPPCLEFDLVFAPDNEFGSTHGRIAELAIRTWSMIQFGCLESEATTTPSFSQKSDHLDGQPRFVEWSAHIWSLVGEYFSRNPFYQNWDDVPRQLGQELDFALLALQKQYLSQFTANAIPNVKLLIVRSEQEAQDITKRKAAHSVTSQALPTPAASEDKAEANVVQNADVNDGPCLAKRSSDREGRNAWIYDKCC